MKTIQVEYSPKVVLEACGLPVSTIVWDIDAIVSDLKDIAKEANTETEDQWPKT